MFRRINRFVLMLLWLIAALPGFPRLSGQTGPAGPGGGVPITFVKKSGQSEQFSLEWRSPSGTTAGANIPVYQKINLVVLAHSSMPLTRDSFTILLDESPYASGEKSGEVPIVRKPGRLDNQYEYRATVELPREGRRHSVRVQARAGAFRCTTGPLLLERTEKAPEATIVWQSPDPFAGRPLRCDQTTFEVKATIDAKGNAIALPDVALFLNGNRIDGGDLEATDRGLFQFRQSVELDNTAEVQTLMLQLFGTVESDIMPVVYRPLRRPNLYVLSIGPQTNLKYAAKDARDIAALFAVQKAGQGLFEQVEVETLTGDAAKTQAVRDAVEGLKTRMNTREINPHDVLLLFISTHGLIDNNDFRLEADDYNAGRVRSTSISLKTDILEILQGMPCKILIFLDACHGPTSDGSKASPDEITRAIQAIDNGRYGIALFSSSQLEEYSYEDALWQNGAFTAAIIKGLKTGKADGQGAGGKKDGIITLAELGDYVQTEVKQMVRQVKNKSQTPRLRNPFGDLPVYVVPQ